MDEVRWFFWEKLLILFFCFKLNHFFLLVNMVWNFYCLNCFSSGWGEMVFFQGKSLIFVSLEPFSSACKYCLEFSLFKLLFPLKWMGWDGFFFKEKLLILFLFPWNHFLLLVNMVWNLYCLNCYFSSSGWGGIASLKPFSFTCKYC